MKSLQNAMLLSEQRHLLNIKWNKKWSVASNVAKAFKPSFPSKQSLLLRNLLLKSVIERVKNIIWLNRLIHTSNLHAFAFQFFLSLY